MAASWVDHAIFWHVYPLGFTQAPIWEEHDARPRLQSLTEQLDYAVALGVNGLVLGPIFASHTHGYDTVDHFQIDSRLGTEADFDNFIRACQQRGIRVLLDGVFSHVSADFVRPELIAQDEVFEGHDDLKRLRHDDPAVVAYVREVMQYWLERGIDGWRLDAAYSVPADFWHQILPGIHADFPEAFLLGEVIHGDYAEIVASSGMDSVTQYELWKAIWSSLHDENFFELEWSLRRHAEFLEHFVPQTFIGNHDVTRIRTQVGTDKCLVAAALLFLLPGIPSIYYGDELGYEGLKEERFRGDDAIRQVFDFDSSPEQLHFLNAYKALVALRRQHPWLLRGLIDVQHVSNTKFTFQVRDSGSDNHLQVHLTPNTVRISAADGSVLWDYQP